MDPEGMNNTGGAGAPNEAGASETSGAETPDWQKKFETPEKMWESYRSLQSEHDKMRQKYETEQEAGDEGDYSPDDIPAEEPVDPETLIKTVVDSKLQNEVGDIVEYVNQQRINEVMRQAHEVFPDFDFEKEGDALAKELATYNEEYKRKHPVEATLKAIASMRGMRMNEGNEAVLDKLKNFSEGASNRKPPKEVDEVEEIINAKKSSLPW